MDSEIRRGLEELKARISRLEESHGVKEETKSPEFVVGDIVRGIKNIGYAPITGRLGIVINADAPNPYNYTIAWFEEDSGYYHNATGATKIGHGLWVGKNDIEFVINLSELVPTLVL